MSTFSAQTFSRQFGQKIQQDPTTYVLDEDEDLPDDIDTSFASTVSLNSPSEDRRTFETQTVNAGFLHSSPHAMDICPPTPLDPRYATNMREFGRDVANDHEYLLFPSRPSPLFHKLSFPLSNLVSPAVTSSGGSQSTAKGCSKGRSVTSISWAHSSNQLNTLHSAASDPPRFMVGPRPRSIASLTYYPATASRPENTGLRCGYDGFRFSLSSPTDHFVLPSGVCPFPAA